MKKKLKKKKFGPRWTKDWTQFHFRLHPLKIMYYMDLFDSGGREKYLNLRALLFSGLRIVRLYCHHGIGSSGGL